MREEVVWKNYSVMVKIKDQHAEYFKGFHPKQVVVNNLKVICDIERILYKRTSNRGNAEQQEKVFIFPSAAGEIVSEEERSRKMLMQWVEQFNKGNENRAFESVNYLERQKLSGAIAGMLSDFAIGLQSGEGLDLTRIGFMTESSLINAFFEGINSPLLENRKTSIDKLREFHSKQIVLWNVSIPFSLREIRFSYVFKGKRREAVKVFIESYSLQSDSSYLNTHRDLDLVNQWCNQTGKAFSNVKILESALVENIGEVVID